MMRPEWILALLVASVPLIVVGYALSILLPPLVRWYWRWTVYRWRLAQLARLIEGALGGGRTVTGDQMSDASDRLHDAAKEMKRAQEDFRALVRRYGGDL